MDRCILVLGGQYWTGSRFSDHIGEAMTYSRRQADRIAKELSTTIGLRIVVKEAPPDVP
jgi:hypothetical protein